MMEWTPPPDGIAMCQGGDAINPLKEGMEWTPPAPDVGGLGG